MDNSLVLSEIERSRARWLEEAERRKPRLFRARRQVKTVVAPVSGPEHYQGVGLVFVGGLAREQELPVGGTLYLDCGEHSVGHIAFRLQAPGSCRMRYQLGEFPAEVIESFEPYKGSLPRCWLQDGLLDLVAGCAAYDVPGRRAFRFIRLDNLGEAPIRLAGVEVETVSSVPCQAGDDLAGYCDDPLAIIALRTLRNCMQDVFEDGPKRDRRLWLGDLRLQAQVNGVTFRLHSLTERCLYLFAGTARPSDGMVPACVFLDPSVRGGNDYILDYSVLYAGCLLDLIASGGDIRVASDLCRLAYHQVRVALTYLDADGVFADPGGWWLFVDWRQGLDKQAPIHGCIAYACLLAAQLAARLGHEQERAEFLQVHSRLVRAARHAFSPRQGHCWVSGPGQQVSWATAAWLTLGGCITAAEARQFFQELIVCETAVPASCPYLTHHVVEALLSCGGREMADAEIDRVWGAMARFGATAFWEMFDPADHRFSPYGSHHLNSGCHAWSCGPAWFALQPKSSDQTLSLPA